jgi:hypothetical protein
MAYANWIMNNVDMLWKDKTHRVSKKANIAHPVTGQSKKIPAIK